MMEHTTDRLFWTLSAIIIAALLLTISVKAFPKETQAVIEPMTGLLRQADKSSNNVDNAVSDAGDTDDGLSNKIGDATDTNSDGSDGSTTNSNSTTPVQDTQQLQDLTNQNNTLTGQHQSDSNQIDTLSAQITNLQQQLQQANAKNDALNTQLTNATNLAQQQQTTDQATITDIKNKNTELYNEINSGNGATTDKLNSYEAQINTYQTQVSNLQNQLSSLQADDNQKANQVSTLTSDDNNKGTQITNLSNQLASANANVTSTQTDDTNKTNQINTLNSQISSLQANIQQDANSIAALTTQVNTANTNAQNAYNSYQQQLGLDQAQITSLQAQANQAQANANVVSGLQTNNNELLNAAKYLVQTPQQADLAIQDNGDGTATVTGYYNSSNNPTTLNIPNYILVGNTTLNITKIAANSFQGTSLNNVTLPSSLISIGDNAFQGASLNNVTFNGNNLTTIGNYAFSGNNITILSLPNSVNSLGVSAFQQNNLNLINIPTSLTTIPSNAFSNNNIYNPVDIGQQVTSIGFDAFANSGLSGYGDMNSRVSIAKGAFPTTSLNLGGNQPFYQGQWVAATHPSTIYYQGPSNTNVYNLYSYEATQPANEPSGWPQTSGYSAYNFYDFSSNNDGNYTATLNYINQNVTTSNTSFYNLATTTMAYGRAMMQIPNLVQDSSGQWHQITQIGNNNNTIYGTSMGTFNGIAIPYGVTTINNGAFEGYGTSLGSYLELPNTLTTIQSNGFENTAFNFVNALSQNSTTYGAIYYLPNSLVNIYYEGLYNNYNYIGRLNANSTVANQLIGNTSGMFYMANNGSTGTQVSITNPGITSNYPNNYQ